MTYVNPPSGNVPAGQYGGQPPYGAQGGYGQSPYGAQGMGSGYGQSPYGAQPKKNNKPLIIGLVAVVVLALVIVGIFFLTKKSGDGSASNSNEPMVTITPMDPAEFSKSAFPTGIPNSNFPNDTPNPNSPNNEPNSDFPNNNPNPNNISGGSQDAIVPSQVAGFQCKAYGRGARCMKNGVNVSITKPSSSASYIEFQKKQAQRKAVHRGLPSGGFCWQSDSLRDVFCLFKPGKGGGAWYESLDMGGKLSFEDSVALATELEKYR